MLSTFLCACWPSVCLLLQDFYSGLLPVFNQVVCFLKLSCMSCLYILGINPFWDIPFANILSYSDGCLFILSVVSFNVQKFSSLIRAHLIIFAFVFFVWGDRSKKILLRLKSESVLPMFSFKSFIVFGLWFWSLIHF